LSIFVILLTGKLKAYYRHIGLSDIVRPTLDVALANACNRMHLYIYLNSNVITDSFLHKYIFGLGLCCMLSIIDVAIGKLKFSAYNKILT